MWSFWWLDTYGKTPHDFGVRNEQLDPAWERAIVEIRAGIQDERILHRDK